MTIHNIAFLGQFPPSLLDELGLSTDLFHPDGIEFYGSVSLLKAGLISADWITTVSPRYARELETPELGAGLDGLLRARSDRLVGILNGADYSQWDPMHDPMIPARYGPDQLAGKRECKAAVQRALGLPVEAHVPLTVAVSRLTDQKGFDQAAVVLEGMLRRRKPQLQMAILGTGDAVLEARLLELAARFPQAMAVRIGYDERLAHQLYAAADLYLMPSRYEPCGLGQLYALRYGAPPIVRATGGLDDTVVDGETGFKFEPFTAAALERAWLRALSTYRDETAFQALQQRSMAQDFSWGRSAERYRELYLSHAEE